MIAQLSNQLEQMIESIASFIFCGDFFPFFFNFPLGFFTLPVGSKEPRIYLIRNLA